MAKARDYIPALKFGHKIYPEDVAGMLGLPSIGDIYYVDPYAGSDTANSGSSQDQALATVAAAFALCTNGHQDVIIIAPTGGTGRTTEPAAIAWNKRFTHLIGNAAPTGTTPRAGMSFTLASATTTPQLVVSENGCIFKNVVFYQAVATSYGGVQVSGLYNYFEGCHFCGVANATAGDSADGRDLVLTGGENVFVGCTIGCNTVARSAANANLEVKSGASCNRFEGCRFQHWADNNGVLHLICSAGNAINRFMTFDHCAFIGGGSNSGATTASLAMTTGNAIGGSIIMWDTWLYGSTHWANDYTMLEAFGNMTIPTAADAGLSIGVAV